MGTVAATTRFDTDPISLIYGRLFQNVGEVETNLWEFTRQHDYAPFSMSHTNIEERKNDMLTRMVVRADGGGVFKSFPEETVAGRFVVVALLHSPRFVQKVIGKNPDDLILAGRASDLEKRKDFSAFASAFSKDTVKEVLDALAEGTTEAFSVSELKGEAEVPPAEADMVFTSGDALPRVIPGFTHIGRVICPKTTKTGMSNTDEYVFANHPQTGISTQTSGGWFRVSIENGETSLKFVNAFYNAKLLASTAKNKLSPDNLFEINLYVRVADGANTPRPWLSGAPPQPTRQLQPTQPSDERARKAIEYFKAEYGKENN